MARLISNCFLFINVMKKQDNIKNNTMEIVDKQRALLPLRKSIRLLNTFTVLEQILRNA